MKRFLFLPFFIALAAHADISPMMLSVDGSNDAPPAAQVLSAGSHDGASGTSQAQVFAHGKTGGAGTVSLTDVSMLMGPSFDDMSTRAPDMMHPYSGVGTRHLLRLAYALSDTVSIAPTLDVTDNFYNSRQGELIFNDPSVLVSVDDVNSARFGRAHLKGAVWFQVFAPTSAVSQEINDYTQVAFAYVSRVHLTGSRFSFSGIARLRAEPLRSPATGNNLVLGGWLLAEQVNYRASRTLAYFLMNHVNGNIGPQTVTVQTPLASEDYRKAIIATQTVFDCLMAGVKIDVTPGVELSPRLDWLVNLPVTSTTIGLNAAFHVI